MRWLMDTASGLPMIAARARQIEAASRHALLDDGDTWFERAFRVRTEGAVAKARESGILEIPISGVLASEDMPLWYWFADTTFEHIRRMIEAAQDEPRIRAILMRIQSPGGTVDGTSSLAGFIRRSSARSGGDRPIWAWVERASSAAYWLASQADRIVGPDTADVGSIGVITEHVDVSRMLEEMGITVTPIFAGAAKADFHDARPLSDEARTRVQAEIDALRAVFAAAVAATRPLSREQVIATEARSFIGAAAVEVGLIDALATTIDDSRAALLASSGKPRTTFAPAAAKTAARRPAARTRRKTMARYRNVGCRTAAGNPTAGEALAAELNRLIDNQVSEERTREDVIAAMAEAAGIEPSTVNQILAGTINCPPIERLDGFAQVLDVDVSELVSAAEEDGCIFEPADDGEEGQPPAATRSGPAARVATTKAADSARVLAVLDLPEAKGREAAAKELARAGLDACAAKAVLATMPKATDAGFLAAMAAEQSPRIGPGAPSDSGERPSAADRMAARFAKR